MESTAHRFPLSVFLTIACYLCFSGTSGVPGTLLSPLNPNLERNESIRNRGDGEI